MAFLFFQPSKVELKLRRCLKFCLGPPFATSRKSAISATFRITPNFSWCLKIMWSVDAWVFSFPLSPQCRKALGTTIGCTRRWFKWNFEVQQQNGPFLVNLPSITLVKWRRKAILALFWISLYVLSHKRTHNIVYKDSSRILKTKQYFNQGIHSFVLLIDQMSLFRRSIFLFFANQWTILLLSCTDAHI